MKKSKAMVVLSGGQDSTTCLFWAKQNFDEVYAISFDYGQLHRIELDAARKVAEMADVSHETLNVEGLLASTSPLINRDNELEQYRDYEQMEKIIGNRVELTFVPLRNPFFLLVAANQALALDCFNLVTGICEADNANYPDCTERFKFGMEAMLNEALGTTNILNKQIRIWTPLIHKTKAESIELALELPGCYDALAYSHTGYDGKYPPTDMNHANVLRARGFEEAGIADPLVIRAWREGLMSLPETSNYDGFRQ